ncbi:MAG: hypothetical protein GY847_09345, partial [Proteobacteria bacterium]|nr:hypothetical protein [Pseudomonadota bacterium]
ISQWAVYPVDEPGLYDGPRIQALMEKVIPIKAAAPDVPIYANPSSEVTVENFSEMAQYIDVWCPELGVLLRRPELVDFFLQDKSKRVWCYEAPGPVKFLHPLGYYRSQALTAFAIGLQGSGYWTTVYHDIWKNLVTEEYGVVYGKGGTFVESRRWHATRDGSEDARALYYLKHLTEKGRKKGIAADLCAQAETLIGSDLFSILERPMKADDVTRYIIEDYDPKLDDLLSLRQRAAELTLRLQAVLNKSPR